MGFAAFSGAWRPTIAAPVIAAIGNSIVAGANDEVYGIGFVKPLRDGIAGQGRSVTMVGRSGTDPYKRTGTSGQSLLELNAVIATAGWLPSFSPQPNLVLILSARADMNTQADTDAAPANYRTLLTTVRTVYAGAVGVLEMTLDQNATINTRRLWLNTQMPAIVEGFPGVAIVPTGSILTAADMADSTHPNYAGGDKIAGACLWYT